MQRFTDSALRNRGFDPWSGRQVDTSASPAAAPSTPWERDVQRGIEYLGWTLTLAGKPFGKPVARVGGGRGYDDPAWTAWKDEAVRLIRQSLPPPISRPYEGAVRLHLGVWFAAPPDAGGYPATCLPDGDNIAKAVQDALKGWLYTDDKQVTHLTVRKRWGSQDCVCLTASADIPDHPGG